MNDIPLGPRRLDEPSPDDEAIRRVLRLVGPRPDVPEDAVEAARAAARAEWRRKVRGRARWSRVRQSGIWLAAALVIVALGLLLRSRPWTPRGPAAVLETADAALTVDPALEGMSAGTQIPAGARIVTGDGRGALRLLGGPSVRLDSETRVRLVSSAAVELERGAVYVDSAGGTAVEIRTALGTVTDVGTQFEVRLAADPGSPPDLRVRVREGRVLLSLDGEAHEGRPGDQLAVGASRRVIRSHVATHGADWDWVLAVAPVFEAEGRTLGTFLEWLCREGGWTLRYDEPSLAAAASGILNGDTRGLTPLEAAEIWLKGSGLGYRLDEDGAFVVRRADNS